MFSQFTVGVLTRNSIETIQATLESLRAQTYAVSGWDLFIIDHNSSDGTQQLLEDFVGVQSNARLISRQENHLARSRQLILDEAATDWVVFVDSDVILPEDWLATAARWLESPWAREEALAGLGGPLRLRPRASALEALPDLQKHFLGHFSARQMSLLQKNDGPLRVSHIPTAAAIFRRTDAQAAGGFDPRFVDCGEDLELGERMTRSGRSLWVVPELAVDHALSCKTQSEWIRRAFRFGRTRVRVARTHGALSLLRFEVALPLGFAVLHFVAAWLGMMLVFLGSYYAVLLLCFWRHCPPRRRLVAAWLALATHEAYAWGEFVELALTPIALAGRLFKAEKAVPLR